MKLSSELLASYRDNAARREYFGRIAAPTTALLVIDMQNHWVDANGFGYLERARELVPNINRIARTLRARGGAVVWVRCSFSGEGRSSWPMVFQHLEQADDAARMRAELTPGHPMHALWPGLEVHADDIMVDKDRFSALIQGASNLERMLRDKGIDTVLVSGVATNVCCESTARDAMMLDFRTVMIEDANAARSDAEHIAALTTFLRVFGAVMSTSEVLALLEQG